MALRMAMEKSLKRMLQQQHQIRRIGTAPSFTERLKTSPMHERPLKSQMLPKGKALGNYVPIYVTLGMIGLQAVLGFHIIKQHFAHDPGVHLKKSRRESIPELTEPDKVAHESSELMRKSFFRKVAHIQEFKTPLDAPHRGNPLDREPRVESLKTVGIDPA